MTGHYLKVTVFKSERKTSKRLKALRGILFDRRYSVLLKYYLAPMYIRVALQIAVDAT